MFEGVVKLRLVHAPGRSVFLPDLVALPEAEPLWFQPASFGPPLLSFDANWSAARFDVDTVSGDKLFIETSSDRHLTALPDGSHLHRCDITSVADLPDRATGRCRFVGDGRIELLLFHHTAEDTLSMIEASEEVWGSPWNIQGTRKLKNVTYAYFTWLSEIQSDQDLEQIAMASGGRLAFVLDGHETPDGIVNLRVCRESTANRNATLPLWIASEAVAPAHIWQHTDERGVVWYEVARPAIQRVGLEPGGALRFRGDSAFCEESALKRFEYVVIGDCADAETIIAPFHEEETDSIFKIEQIEDGDPISFWRANANVDHFGGADLEYQELVNDNPSKTTS